MKKVFILIVAGLFLTGCGEDTSGSADNGGGIGDILGGETGAGTDTTGDTTDSMTTNGMSNAGTETTGPELDTEVRVEAFGSEASRTFESIAKRSNGLSRPRDLEFNPDNMNELWVVDRDFDGTVIFTNPGTDDQLQKRLIDRAALHFMEEVSSLAFSDRGSFATCQESQNTYNNQGFPNNFMGPALWPSNLEIYSAVNQREFDRLNGSHLDMLHQSPLCMGITHESGHAFWVADGFNGHIVRYDFQEPHVPGGDDHSDGRVSRYTELTLTYLPDVPSHLDIDDGWLFVADAGAGRIYKARIDSGREVETLTLTNEPLELYNRIGDVTWSVVSEGMEQPSGIVAVDGTLYVSDYKTGQLVAMDYDGLELDRIETGSNGVTGLTMGPEGQLWFVNTRLGQVMVLRAGVE